MGVEFASSAYQYRVRQREPDQSHPPHGPCSLWLGAFGMSLSDLSDTGASGLDATVLQYCDTVGYKPGDEGRRAE